MKQNFNLSFVLLLALMLGFTACNAEKNTEVGTETTEVVQTEPTDFGGLALYTLRDSMAKDPKGTLQAVAAAGYAYIEAAGYSDGKFYGMAPTEFKAYLESLGLQPKSTHMGGVNLENADQQIADAKAAGFEYFVIPVPPMGMFTAGKDGMGMKGSPAELAKILNTLGEKSTAAGLKLLYHNHDFEFKPMADGSAMIDYLLENSDAKNVNFQMDLFWVTKAGVDPLTYFEKYPGRFTAWHVKDMNEEGNFAPVGTGSIDFKRILAERDKSGMEFYLVEQDNTFGLNPLEAIKISHNGLEEIGFK
ncbi:sugar phosphate isomerase/epimerase family protein [Algoriphagus antarcticus]|uniref:Sugar phosphate isomerase/epimerase n=1 Tax=Algoriphagus antarcticus TaxID=238540 RepID=A0A3E0DNR3_9BACT|nr:sugar phosphate isomerase/epimerase [Algoriphagus antarcticus]REG83437.1 sugar phosphate isomerase/epimerase [Algoriphagus antarcticus]